MIRTSVHAALWFNSVRIGKVRNIDLQIQRDALEDTRQGDVDRTFINGLRNSTASGVLFYDPEDVAVAAIMAAIFDDATTLQGLTLVFDQDQGLQAQGDAVITNATLGAQVGSAQTCQLSFQISGKPTATLSTP